MNKGNSEVAIPEKCNKDLPNLSVGDVNLTYENYEKFKKSNNLFVLGVSDKNCP